MRQLFLLLILLIGCCWKAAAQRLEEFSADRGEFTTQLGNYMTASKQKTLEDVFKEFEKNFKGGMFSDEEFQQILKTSNAMLGYRMTASPYFMDYLAALMVVKKTENPEQQFKDWHFILDSMLADIENQRLNPFLEFVQFSKDFFEKKALRYSDLGTSWYAITDRYTLNYKDKKPSVIFEKLDLMAAAKKDSIFIYQTAGEYFPVEQRWKGKGGKVTWERLGLAPEVYVIFEDYELEAKKSLYEVSKAKLHYPQFFGNKVIEGTFSDKLVSGNDATLGTYPRFESALNRLDIENIGKGIKLTGGFRLQGTTVYGFGNKKNKTEINLYNDKNELVFHGASELFIVRRGDLIVGERVESSIYFGKDSIYHPSVNIRFNILNREMQLSRGERGSDRNPFYSSVHQINLETEDIRVHFAKDTLFIGKKAATAGFKGDVAFESLQYFRKGDLQRIQNVASVNPIALMKMIAEKNKRRVIDANVLAKEMNPKFTVDNIQSLLYDLVAQGFINYDSDEQLVEVKDKVFLYANADQKKVDYDVLKIYSKTDSTNAVLDLKNKSMEIGGVARLEFSPRQRVGLKPSDDKLTLKENRNMDFDGRLFAGMAIFEGSDFHFNYDKFQIKLDSVRYFDLFVPTGQLDQNNNPIALSIASRIEHLSGILLIDAPKNKSGEEDIPIFPSFQSKDKSFVYYDIDTIQAKVYPRDSFYFQLDPFSFNSLDKFTPKDIQFKGTLHSKNIFPDIKETLRLQADNSLGFVTQTPEEGYPAYLDKGTYTGEINISNKGLLGKGKLKYLGASINAKDIVFKPQQTIAKADKFDLEENRTAGEEVPKVRGLNVSIDWRPYRDSMYITSETAPFQLFDKSTHTLSGTLILTPGGLKGNGLLDWDKASMTSRLFSFGAFSSKADTTDLKIKATNAADLALRTTNVKGDVNFDDQVGTFKANDEFLLTSLPYNQYETSMNEFTWDMKEENITFKSDENKLGRFLSVHPDQDSLRFQGKTALYDLKTSELKIGGTPYIVSADAYVYPDSGRVEVRPGGVMTTLQNARIVCDTVNKNHVINRATVDIQGRRFYRASGFYEYNIADKEQEIEFSDIIGQPVGKGKMSEKRVVTRANGIVKPEDNFIIDHKTEFHGTISLSAESKNLQFDGFARLKAEKLPGPFWFTVSSEGDKKNLYIRYDTPKSDQGEPLETGLYLSKETARIYPRVMMPLHFRKDRPIFPAKGVFNYNEVKDQFVFGDTAKILTNSLRGNQLVFKNTDGSVEVEGKFNLGSALKYVTVDAAGIGKTSFPPIIEKLEEEIVSDEDTTLMMQPVQVEEPAMPVNIEVMAGIKLAIPEQLLKIMITDITSSSFDASIITYLTDVNFYKKAASEIFPINADTEAAIVGMSSGYLDIPKKYNPYTFVFSRLKLKWDPDYQSFVTTDSKVGINSINGDPLHKVLTCHLEFKMPTNEDDRLYIYIKSPSELFYFFGYKQGILSVTSNNTAFMDALGGLKEKDLVLKMPDGETYEIQAVEPSDAQLFLRRIQAVGK